MNRNSLIGLLFFLVLLFTTMWGLESLMRIKAQEDVRILAEKLAVAEREKKQDQVFIETWKTAAQDWKQKFQDLEVKCRRSVGR